MGAAGMVVEGWAGGFGMPVGVGWSVRGMRMVVRGWGLSIGWDLLGLVSGWKWVFGAAGGWGLVLVGC